MLAGQLAGLQRLACRPGGDAERASAAQQAEGRLGERNGSGLPRAMHAGQVNGQGRAGQGRAGQGRAD